MSAKAVSCDKLTGQSQDDVLSLLEVVRLVRACLGGLLILVKVKTGNKGAGALLAIRGHYLTQLQSILKPFLYHVGRSEGLPRLSAQDGFYLVRMSSKRWQISEHAATMSPLARANKQNHPSPLEWRIHLFNINFRTALLLRNDLSCGGESEPHH